MEAIIQGWSTYALTSLLPTVRRRMGASLVGCLRSWLLVWYVVWLIGFGALFLGSVLGTSTSWLGTYVVGNQVMGHVAGQVLSAIHHPYI